MVVDNAGDYLRTRRDARLEVHRPGTNLRWIGSVNWSVMHAQNRADDVCIVLDNDTRLSQDFSYWLTRAVLDCADTALTAPCYDDFWLNQRARDIPNSAADYAGTHSYRPVAFCDGTALALSVRAKRSLGLLDTEAFPRHGYGAGV